MRPHGFRHGPHPIESDGAAARIKGLLFIFFHRESDLGSYCDLAMNKILLVDDIPEVTDLLSVFLRGKGYAVTKASGGEQALALIKKDPPDLVLLDVMMPGMNGFEVCRALRQSPATAELPVILLTSKSQPSDKFWGMEVGANHYVTKPFELQALAELIHRTLGTAGKEGDAVKATARGI